MHLFFQRVLDKDMDLVNGVVRGVDLKIPDPPEGETFDPNMVNLEFTDDDGDSHIIGHADTEDICDDIEHGWYYDDNDNPETIHVCPQTCDWIKEHEDGEISIQFGCETEDVIVM